VRHSYLIRLQSGGTHIPGMDRHMMPHSINTFRPPATGFWYQHQRTDRHRKPPQLTTLTPLVLPFQRRHCYQRQYFIPHPRLMQAPSHLSSTAFSSEDPFPTGAAVDTGVVETQLTSQGRKRRPFQTRRKERSCDNCKVRKTRVSAKDPVGMIISFNS
jgi:hypothetical protein